MKIATILLNYNSAADCRKCIGYLQRQQGVEQEIIVVDNCSRSEECDAAKAICDETGATFIANNRNSGYNAGNNVGLRYAAKKGYHFALIANPDMEFPQEDYLAKMLTAINTDEDIVVCGSDIVTPEGVHQNPKQRGNDCLAEYFQWMKNIFCRKKKTTSEQPDWIEDYSTSKECRCLNGCCFIIRMSFAKEIGFFDEGTFLYGEEPILGAQVENAGKKMFYNANTTAVHDHKKSKEGSRAFCFKHWRHSMVHSLYRYSKMPWYKKLVAQGCIEIYFILLRTSNIIKNIKK